jgi:MerR family transcriptional regulator/heat shock protein HspR
MKENDSDVLELRNGAVYIISVAAQLADVHPQTLRIYERKGLLKPDRVKNRRRYSDADIERCRLIQELTRDMGVNLAGVKMILEMRDSLDALNEEVRMVQGRMDELRHEAVREMEELRRSFRNELVPVKRGGLVPIAQADPFRQLRRKR